MNPAVRGDRDHPTRIVRRVARNTLFLGIADVANKLMMFVFYLMAARHLGVQQFGVLSFALAFVTMLSVFTDLGLGTVTAREIARDRGVARRYVSNAVSIKTVASLLVIALIVLSVRLLGYPTSTARVVGVCSFLVIENAFTLYFGFVFQGFERMEFTAMGRVLQTLVLIAGALALSHSPASAERYGLLFVGAGLVSAAFAWVAASAGFVKPGLSLDLHEWKRLLLSALPIGLAAAFVVLYYWNGVTILSKLRGEVEVGVYSAPWRLALGMGLAGWAFSGAVYPVMSRLFATDRPRLTRLMELALKYMLILVLPIAILGWVLAKPVILLLYGGAYLPSVAVLRILVWWVACVGLNSLLSNYFLAVNRSRIATVQAAAALGVNVAANFILIPFLGAPGVAVALVLAEGASLVFLFVLQARTADRVRGLPLFKTAFGVILALVPSSVAAALVARWHAAAAIAVALATYALLLLLLRVLGGRDLHSLRVVSRSDHAS